MKKLFVSVFLILGGTMIFVFGSPYYSVFPTNGNKVYYLTITIFFLVASIILKRKQHLSNYGNAVYSLFTASLALLFLSTGIFNIFNHRMSSLQFLAMDKFSQFLHVVPILIGLTLLLRSDLQSIFLAPGNLKRGFTFGLISFIGFAATAVTMGLGSSNYFSSLWAAIPWQLLFIFANAIMEELWFRGIFLKNYEAVIGRNATIIVTAIVFGASHINAVYEFPGGGFVFGLVVFGLGIVGAFEMFRDDSLIGPVLFHAGYDLLIIIPVLNSI